jgi:cell division septation protein DedD
MTRTDVMASSRPRNPGVAPSGTGSSTILRGLRALPIALLLALAVLLPSTAIAAEPGTSGYGYGTQEPNKPSTSTTPTTTPQTTTTTPKTGTLPSKESEKPTTPTSETEPEKTSSSPTATASTLPFTGFDLRWDIGFGIVLLGAGFSILAMQRRQRHGSH